MMEKEPKRIRVLSLTPELLLGGDENRMLGLGATIDRDRFDFEVVTLNAPNAENEKQFGSLRERFVDADISLHDLGVTVRAKRSHPLRPDHWIRKLVVVCGVVWRLRKLIREQKFDVLDAHGKDAIVIGALVSWIQRVGTVATLYHTWSGQVSHWLGKLLLARYDRVVTDSDARRRDIEEWIVGCRKVNVICNGIHPPISGRPTEEIWGELGLPNVESEIVFGQVGRLVPFKGQMTLLRAAKRVLEHCPNAFFLLIGFPPKFSSFQEELQREAEELGIADRVHIGGYGGNVADVWKLIDIHVHASHFDSLPNAILEGMSLAKPAVVTNVGGIPELVANEISGLVVSPKDELALADGMLRLFESPDLAQALGEAAQRRYKNSCHPELVARQLEELMAAVSPHYQRANRVRIGTYPQSRETTVPEFN